MKIGSKQYFRYELSCVFWTELEELKNLENQYAHKEMLVLIVELLRYLYCVSILQNHHVKFKTFSIMGYLAY